MARQEVKQRTFDVLAIVGVFVAYTVTIRLAMGLDLAGCLLGGAANTIPVVIFGVAVRRIVAQRLSGAWLEPSSSPTCCCAPRSRRSRTCC